MPPQEPNQTPQNSPQPPDSPVVNQPYGATPAQPAYQQTTSPYGPGANPAGEIPQESASNAMAIIGLIFSFLFAPIGLIISIIALKKHKDGASKVMSIIGIVVSALGILFAALAILLMFTATPALQQSAKSAKERTDIMNLQAHLESAYADNNGASYPTLTQLNDENWRTTHMAGLNAESLSPNSSVLQLVAGNPTEDSYAYNPSPANCDASQANPCKSYILKAKLPDGKMYTVNSPGN